MSQQPVEANVVLTADTAQYDASMTSSASATDAVVASVDLLSQKIANLSKSAGKGLIGISAADTAVITATTAAYASWENQMSSLQAQAGILSRTMTEQDRTFRTYATSVNNLRSEFGQTTGEAQQLVQILSRMSDNTSSISNLSQVFSRMSQATGESTTALSSSLLQLQKTMGTPQRDTEKYANALTSLSASANTSASEIANFAQQIAPVGRLVGMTQTDIMGVSQAFIKSGQDGFRAATVFNKMMTDINHATQTGSPDLAKYTNLLGVTTEQFKEMSGTEQIVKIFEQINRLGPNAVSALNQMGLDGARSIQAITAMSQQTGGLGTSIQQARAAMNDDSTGRGSKAAMSGLFDELARTRQELQMTAEAFGERFAPAAEKFFQVINKIAGVTRALTEGPLGTLAAIVAGIVAPFAGAAGGVLLFAGALAKLATAALFFKGSGFRGLIEGAQGGGTVGGGSMMAGRGLLRTGQQIEQRGSWFQRGMYNTGAMAGSGIYRMRGGDEGAAARASRTGPSPFSRTAAMPIRGLGWGLRNLIDPIYSPLTPQGMNDPTRRFRMITSPTLAGTFAGPAGDLRNLGNRAVGSMGNWVANQPGFVGRMGQRLQRAGVDSRIDSAGLFPRGGGVITSADAANMAREASARSLGGFKGMDGEMRQFSKSMNDATKQTVGFGRSLSGLGRDLTRTVGTIGMAGVGAGITGGRYALGAASNLFGGPLGLTLMGGMAGMAIWDAKRDKSEYEYEDMAGMFGLNRTAPATLNEEAARAVTPWQSRNVTASDMATARGGNYELDNSQLAGMTQEQLFEFLSPIAGTIFEDPAQTNQLKLDLVNILGGGDAQELMADLFEVGGDNQEMGYEALVRQAFDSSTKAGTGKNMNRVFSSIEMAATAAHKEGDLSDVYRVRAEGLVDVLENTPDGMNWGSRQAKSFTEAINKEYFGGEDIFDRDRLMSAGTIGLQGGLLRGYSEEEQKRIIDAGMRGTDLERLTVSMLGNEEELKKFTEGLGLEKDLTGIEVLDAVKQIQLGTYDGFQGGPEEQDNSVSARLQSAGGRRAEFDSNRKVQESISSEEDANAFYEAVQDLTRSYDLSQEGTEELIRELGNVRATYVTESDQGYRIGASAQQYGVQRYNISRSLMGRTDRFGDQSSQFRGYMSVMSGDENEFANREQAQLEFQQAAMEQGAYFQQLLLQQREFEISIARSQEDFGIQRERMEEQYNISRQRAQYDFNLQRQYQEEDFRLSRERAEDDFQLQRRRGVNDYERQMRRSQSDFNRSRRRQEEDYQHQVVLMTERSARQMHNIYERTQVQRTSSAGWLLGNNRDQVQRMQRQTQELDQLRDMGVSDDVIKQLGLTDAQNAQALSRFVAEVASDPSMVQEFNKAVRDRLRAAAKLVTDESSSEWEEFQRQYKLSRERAEEDFQRQVRRSRQDFRRQMSRMNDDFQKSMSRQAEDYEKAQKRQQRAFSLSMARAAEDYERSTRQMQDDFGRSMSRARDDVARMGEEIGGSLEEILTKAVKKLSGNSREQAREVRKILRELKGDATGISAELMEDMSNIFGFKFNADKYKKTKNTPNSKKDSDLPFHSRADGGVLPGYSPGHDDHQFYSPTAGRLDLSGGEAIMRPEWTRAVGGPKVIDQMNRMAKYGGLSFAMGGVTPAPGQWTRHTSGYPWARWSGDINVPGPGDYGNPVLSWKGGRVADVQRWNHSYGHHVRVNHPGSNEQTLYAHLSKILVDVGDTIRAGQKLGEVGSTGNSSGPHLHFEIKGGTGQLNLGADSLGMSADGILKDLYPKLERTASKVNFLGGIPEGQMSDLVNYMAREGLKRRGIDGSKVGDGLNHGVPSLTDAGGGNRSNQDYVRRAMQQFGWNQWPSLYNLVMKESGFRNTAQNPTSTAYGMFQFLDSTWAGVGGTKTSDPWLQSIYGMRYIKNRYGDPNNAWKFWQANNWYGDGALFSSPQVIGVGERGPEAVIPLDEKGTDFMAGLMQKLSPGLEARSAHVTGGSPVGCSHVENHYSIDSSTTFSGAITVQANNPQELVNQLAARQRVRALTQPVLGGR